MDNKLVGCPFPLNSFTMLTTNDIFLYLKNINSGTER